MPAHREVKILPYKASQILDLVMDIEKYPDFLPWCVGANITEVFDQNHLQADLSISFKGLFEQYKSDVRVTKNQDGYEVTAQAIDGPFQNLINIWQISDIVGIDNSCQVEFFIDFEFKSKILGKMIGLVFAKATDKMINAFEKRAHQLCD